MDELPLFPLRTVLFPGGVLGLKVFEARYLDLVSRCLREQRPFGVIGLRQGAEAGPAARPVRLEEVGVLAHIEDVDSEQPGILELRCRGGSRFRLSAAPVQQPGGLWVCAAETLPDDEVLRPAPAMQATVRALAQAIEALKAQDALPFAEPFQLDDAGWVANRWCEILPVSLAAKQRLMALEDAALRLSLVDEYLRGKRVVNDD
jgi:hypothetical protein